MQEEVDQFIKAAADPEIDLEFENNQGQSDNSEGQSENDEVEMKNEDEPSGIDEEDKQKSNNLEADNRATTNSHEACYRHVEYLLTFLCRMRTLMTLHRRSKKWNPKLKMSRS